MPLNLFFYKISVILSWQEEEGMFFALFIPSAAFEFSWAEEEPLEV